MHRVDNFGAYSLPFSEAKAAKGFSPGPELTAASSKSYSVNMVSSVTMDPFSGSTLDFKD